MMPNENKALDFFAAFFGFAELWLQLGSQKLRSYWNSTQWTWGKNATHYFKTYFKILKFLFVSSLKTQGMMEIGFSLR